MVLHGSTSLPSIDNLGSSGKTSLSDADMLCVTEWWSGIRKGMQQRYLSEGCESVGSV